jgi:flavodoxin
MIMKTPNICICYGTCNGATEQTAHLIKNELARKGPISQIEILNIYGNSTPDWTKYDFLVLGSPTYYNGQLQDDWNYIISNTSPKELNNKPVALFGLGDQESFRYTFNDGIGLLAKWLLKDCLASLAGYWPARKSDSTEKVIGWPAFKSGSKIPEQLIAYHFEESAALTSYQGQPAFYGLALDRYSQNDLTTDRIALWCQQLINEWDLNTI